MERRPNSSPTMFSETASAHERSVSTCSSAKRDRSRRNGRRDAIRSQDYYSAAKSRASWQCERLVYPHIGYLFPALSSAVSPPLQAPVHARSDSHRSCGGKDRPIRAMTVYFCFVRVTSAASGRDYHGPNWASRFNFVTCRLSKEPQLELIRRDQGLETGLGPSWSARKPCFSWLNPPGQIHSGLWRSALATPLVGLSARKRPILRFWRKCSEPRAMTCR